MQCARCQGIQDSELIECVRTHGGSLRLKKCTAHPAYRCDEAMGIFKLTTTPERSAIMSRIRSKDTGPELRVRNSRQRRQQKRKLTREQREKAFADAEASLKLEGLTPSDLYYKLKEKILNGELTTDEAIVELDRHYSKINGREIPR